VEKKRREDIYYITMVLMTIVDDEGSSVRRLQGTWSCLPIRKWTQKKDPKRAKERCSPDDNVVQHLYGGCLFLPLCCLVEWVFVATHLDSTTFVCCVGRAEKEGELTRERE
jgi:hypothetical protein